MILAKIGSETFKLETLAEAETVLKIFGQAKRLDWHFDGRSRSYYTEKPGMKIEVTVSQGENIVSDDEHAAIQAERATEA